MSYTETQFKINTLSPDEYKKLKTIRYGYALVSQDYVPPACKESWLMRSRLERTCISTLYHTVPTLIAFHCINLLVGWDIMPRVLVGEILFITALICSACLAGEKNNEIDSAIHKRDMREGRKYQPNLHLIETFSR